LEWSPGPLLVVAAHPDDEALGCAGTIAKATFSGHEVSVVFFTDGVGAREEEIAARLRPARRAAAEKSLAILGARRPTFLDLPDNRLDSVPMLELAWVVERELERIRPRTILTHHHGDLNVDHRAVHEAVMTAVRPQAGRSPVDVLCFEVASSTEWTTPQSSTAFLPQVAVDVTEHLDKKIEALRMYAEEMREWPHARSVEAVVHLARWRGATFGVEAAEAFSVARMRF
jgi:LmbE family N-acetylglucosaminyl deacetylase